MHVVIDIPNELYDSIMEIKNSVESLHGFTKFIANGTPLPEGHGNLIDASQLMTITDIRADGSEVSYVFYDEIEDAPIIVKADKEESEV